MKIKRLLAGVVLLVAAHGALASGNAGAAEGDVVKVMTYNIRHGKGLDNQLDLKRIVRVIEAERPDIVALQELDSATRRSNGVDEMALLGEEALYRPLFGPAIPFDGGKYGVGILTRERPLKVEQYALPDVSEPRTLLVAELTDFCFACTHLPLRAEDRMAALPKIVEVAKQSKKPFILCGDWNDEPSSVFIQCMQNYFTILSDTTQMTFPADKPRACIDYIAVYKGTEGARARAERAYVVEEAEASDHRPVRVDVKWASGEEEDATDEEMPRKVYDYAEEMPYFPGGDTALERFIEKNYKYPDDAREEGVKGVVLLRFVVLKNGKVGAVEVLKKLSPSCDKEAKRVVRTLPRFSPARVQGEAVAAWYQMQIPVGE